MIIWKPTKSDIERVAQFRIAVMVSENSERILIGSQEEIAKVLDDDNGNQLFLDEVRPFGSFLLDAHCDKKDWNEVLFWLSEAHGVFAERMSERALKGDSPLGYERKAQALLQEIFDTHDPYLQYVAMKIWYEYWKCRGSKKPGVFESCHERMQNLIRSFGINRGQPALGQIISADDQILSTAIGLMPCDFTNDIRQSKTDEEYDYIVLNDSLIPLNRYYKNKLLKWPKSVMECKLCGRKFMVGSLHNTLCSDECREEAKRETIRRRKEDPVRNRIETVIRNTNDYWDSRRRKILKSSEWSENDRAEFENARKLYKQKKKEQRRSVKAGEMTVRDLEDWLFEQQRIANRIIEEHDGDKKVTTP